MSYKMRSYQGEDDYWRIREFLRQIFLLNGRRQKSWDVVRFDYWRWHGNENLARRKLEEVIFLWEAANGQLVAVLNPEGGGDAFLQTHPGLAPAELEEQMLSMAEKHFAAAGPDGRQRLMVWAGEKDESRKELLRQRGYQKGSWIEYQRRRSLDLPIPESTLAPGYTLRAVGDGAELIERCYASGLAFHNGDIRVAADNRDVSWYRNIQTAPLYRRDLDLVAVAPDGAVASFCTIWFDDVTRCAVFEPVATVPDQQRRGLAKAVMCEGLRRLKRMGATMAFVGSYSNEAGALYASVGFTEFDLSEMWIRQM